MTKNKKKKHILWPIFIIGLAVGLILSFYYNSSTKAVSSNNDENIKLQIQSGSSSKTIATILEDNDLIKNKWVFLIKTKLSQDNTSLKAGNYDLNKTMDLDGIILALRAGGKSGDTVKFTIPEGYEIKDIAEKLNSEGIIDKTRFLDLTNDKKNFEDKFEFLKDLKEDQSLEGFLFPSTYEVYDSHDEEDIIEKMLEGFEIIYNKDIEPNLDEIDFDLNEIITLASIIEREAKLDDERPTISGVFHNRLKTDMRLQSCATVQYILGERKEVLSIAETQIDSPFNTYINGGLPPGPIASPGEKSLIAAIKPEDVDYLFFRTTEKNDGSHTFSNTFDEHKDAAPKK